MEIYSQHLLDICYLLGTFIYMHIYTLSKYIDIDIHTYVSSVRQRVYSHG